MKPHYDLMLNLVILFTHSLIYVDCFNLLLTDNNSYLDLVSYTNSLTQDHYCLVRRTLYTIFIKETLPSNTHGFS